VVCAVYEATLHVSVTHNQWNSGGGGGAAVTGAGGATAFPLESPPVLPSKFISCPRYIWPSAVEPVRR
jgi:hypothetical protein